MKDKKQFENDHLVIQSQHNVKIRRAVDLNLTTLKVQNDFDKQEKQKLKQIMKNIQHMKDQRRAHELVKNLPSRMLKSFDNRKFLLLDDKSYIYDEKFFQESILNKQKISSIGDEKSEISIDMKTKQRTVSLTELAAEKSFKKKERVKTLQKFILKKKTWKRTAKIVMRYSDCIPTLSPSHSVKFIWDISNMIVLLLCMFHIPIAITFHVTMSQLITEQLAFIIPIFLILDILINMNTGYFDKGQVINSRLKIISNFLREKTLQEIVSIIPFLLLIYQEQKSIRSNDTLIESHQTSSQYIFDLFQMLFYMKVLTISTTLWKLEEIFNLTRRYSNLLQLIKLLFTILLINHLFACLWVYIAKIEISNGYETTWMSYDKIVDQGWGSQYLSAFYFTTLTMVTVGYGDILPRNNIEKVLCIATMMLACGVFGYMINQIGVIFNNIFQIDNQIKQQITQIQRFMSKKNINTTLQYQIREYLEYYWREKSVMNQEQEQIIIEQLSESLRSKLLFEANKIVLKDSPIFKQNFSKAVIEQTVPLIKEIKFSPESYIFLKGVQDDGAIYFIENGSVEIVLEKNKNSKVLFQLNKGDSFGAHSFFTGSPRINYIRSKEFTTVLKIGRSEFLQLLERFHEDYETFCSIKDSICFLSDYSRIGLECQCCGSNYHLINNCQYIHFIPKKARIIKSQNDQFESLHLKRTPYRRKDDIKVKSYKNSLFILKEVQKQIKGFLETNSCFFDFSDFESQVSNETYENEQQQVKNKISSNKIYSEEQLRINAHLPLRKNYRNNSLSENSNNLNQFNIPSLFNIQIYDSQNERQSPIDIGYTNSPLRISKSFLNSFEQNQNDLTPKKFCSRKQSEKHPSLKLQIQEVSFSEKQSNQILNQGNQSPECHVNQQQNYLEYNTSSNNFNQEDNQMFERPVSKPSKSLLFNQQNGYKNQYCQIKPPSLIEVPEIEEIKSVNSSKICGDQSCASGDATKMKNQLIINKRKGESRKRETFIKQLLQMVSQLGVQEQKVQQQSIYQQNHDSLKQLFDNLGLVFDKMKQFVKYKPRFNYSTIISRYNSIQDQKRKAAKKVRRGSKNLIYKSFCQLQDSEKNLDGRQMNKLLCLNTTLNFYNKFSLNKESNSQQGDINQKQFSFETDTKNLTIQIDKLDETPQSERNTPNRSTRIGSKFGIQLLNNIDQNNLSCDRSYNQQNNLNSYNIYENTSIHESQFEDENKLSILPYQENKNISNIKLRSLLDQ